MYLPELLSLLRSWNGVRNPVRFDDAIWNMTILSYEVKNQEGIEKPQISCTDDLYVR